ncbi:helix-turn-helix domain-containing protein [Amycolatopsis sp. FDAARGOS 1241]|uniref:helix-turn-helix domain-containing protein n=1 Tax=Amycolatopsis sp. FDAARGOS 1241 TaxID=2778070 RepID=UPI001EF1BC19|nr:helix-turn-helix domain-containing protein [Amycolatopsis sp. FDAARGOS 1241]
MQLGFCRCNERYAGPIPGSRLTHEDRRAVAEGLSGGLPYAEIARRLGRPTSTVSREIRRNGGYRADHADHAQEATLSRAPGGCPRTGPSSPGSRNGSPR